MIKDKIIVCVSASFEQKEELLTTIKKYSQCADERFGCWGEFAFTTEILPECDAILIFNSPFEKISVTCFPENNIAFMMEPGVRWKHPWMFKRLDQFYKVYSPIRQSANTIPSHGFLGWYFQQDYRYLKSLAVPGKTKAISCIASGLKQLKGHRLRLNFIKILQQRLPQIDFFGKGNKFLPDKMEGLLPYRYSIAIENHSSPHYFTEKINDCFLSYTVPLYYGCTNIRDYFPEQSFIAIDIQNPEAAIRKIENVLLQDDWSARLEAVKEARHLVLNKYQPLAGAANALRQMPASPGKKTIVLKPVHRGLWESISAAIHKLVKS
jgi:Glycosyltransferase family 10 (fucosyltransferase) C-term